MIEMIVGGRRGRGQAREEGGGEKKIQRRRTSISGKLVEGREGREGNK